VHRDVSPQNLLVTYDGRAKVLDFGIAKIATRLVHTMTGGLRGKITYMAPEQVRSEPLDRRCDLFALGIVLFELVSGTRLFPQADGNELMIIEQISKGQFPRPRAWDGPAPVALLAIAERALAVQRDDRYPTAREMKADLDQYLSGAGAEGSLDALVEAMHRLFAEDIALYKRLTRAGEDAHVAFAQPARRVLRLVPPQIDPRSAATRTASSRPEALRPAPPARTRYRRWSAAAVLVVALAAAGAWLSPRVPHGAAAAPPQVLSLLVADFKNETGEDVFEGTLEPVFTIALEAAPFINCYKRTDAHRTALRLGLDAGVLDEASGRLVAGSENLNIVTSGSIRRAGGGFAISVRVVEAISGRVVTEQQADASGKQDVLKTVEGLAAKVRTALGDTAPATVQDTFSTSSLEAAHFYALAQDTLNHGELEAAVPLFLKALELDPDFGGAYSGLAIAHTNFTTATRPRSSRASPSRRATACPRGSACAAARPTPSSTATMSAPSRSTAS